VTKQQCRLLLAVKNITPSMSPQATSQTLLGGAMEAVSCRWAFHQSRKVGVPLIVHESSLIIIQHPKLSENLKNSRLSRQLYHACLELAYLPLKQYMTAYNVLRCPDGHFRRVIFSLGPYIADYPEVWLACIVSNWCPK